MTHVLLLTWLANFFQLSATCLTLGRCQTSCRRRTSDTRQTGFPGVCGICLVELQRMLMAGIWTSTRCMTISLRNPPTAGSSTCAHQRNRFRGKLGGHRQLRSCCTCQIRQLRRHQRCLHLFRKCKLLARLPEGLCKRCSCLNV